MPTSIKTLDQILMEGEPCPTEEWQVRAVQSDDCQSYLVWNSHFREALIIDPKDEDINAYRTLISELRDFLWLAVIDTHTHADHISVAAQLSEELKAPLVMHSSAPSLRVQIRVARQTLLPSRSGSVELIPTPGHTMDSITPIWGPFVFGGDVVLFGDSGRDDLPGGDSESHFESLETLKSHVRPEMILLPGHDHRGGRASSWATQLRINPSLTQSKEEFVRESEAFDAPAPRLLKKSLKENFK
ncbi:MAG: MBL fold metallo-hydrolase [Bdellovibrionales bacterium]|nr:MBL fold metallo-hydrolase [Bdellovibrionales bacterium]